MWDSLWFVRFFQSGPVWLIHLLARLVTLLFLNRFVLWCVPTPSKFKWCADDGFIAHLVTLLFLNRFVLWRVESPYTLNPCNVEHEFIQLPSSSRCSSSTALSSGAFQVPFGLGDGVHIVT